jgi:arabinogalactan oligomer / maltooligosaccharide transport system permease protein
VSHEDTTTEKAPWWIHPIIWVIILLALYPIFWVAALAFSGGQQLSLAQMPENPGFWDHIRAATPIPSQFSLSNFVEVWQQQPFGTWMMNSLIVSGLTTIVGVSVACTAGYAFSRFKFAGRETGMTMFLVTQMFPGTLMLIPLYIIVVEWLSLDNSIWALVIVYSVTAVPFCVWMLKGYFDSIPTEIEESAIMDGCSPGRVFLEIVLPLARPAVAVTALFSFMTAWNEFILAATFMEDDSKYTAPVGLRFFVSDFTAQWGYFAAGSLMVSLPVVVLFLFLQKFLVSGLTAGGVKG